MAGLEKSCCAPEAEQAAAPARTRLLAAARTTSYAAATKSRRQRWRYRRSRKFAVGYANAMPPLPRLSRTAQAAAVLRLRDWHARLLAVHLEDSKVAGSALGASRGCGVPTAVVGLRLGTPFAASARERALTCWSRPAALEGMGPRSAWT